MAATADRDPVASLQRRRSSPSSLEDLVDSWVQLIEEGEAEDDLWLLDDRGPRTPRPNEAMNPRVDGLFVTFPDAFGGSLALTHAGGRLQHRGTVAARGPSAPGRTAYRQFGLQEHVACAFEFVAAWFGCPFDAANVRSREGRALSWGLWAFEGDALARCLAAWRTRAPEAFQALFATYGFVLSPRINGAERREEFDLTVAGPPGGAPRDCVSSERIASRQPGLFAVLARSGREPSAQLAQIETAINLSVIPVLSVKVRSRDGLVSIGDRLKSARAVAALLYAELRLGLLGATRLVEGIPEPGAADGEEQTWVIKVSSVLERAGREWDAHQLLRILSSPELDA